MEHEITLPKAEDYSNTNYALARVLVASLDGYTDWTNGDGSAARFITYVNSKLFAPLGIYDVDYKAVGTPTLFYPNPNPLPGSNGSSFGDWSLRPGSRGGHLSIHELTMFAQATFAGLLLPSSVLSQIKSKAAAQRFGLGWGERGTYPDGTKCWGKGGNFPNGTINLNTEIVACDNGVSVMVMGNSNFNVEGAFLSAMAKAFTQP